MRKQKPLRLGDEAGRDAGKQFILTEMSAFQAEAWATRLLLAIGRPGIALPEDIMAAGALGIMAFGVRALASISYDDARPLLAEIMACAQIVPDPSRPTFARPIEFETDDIEEVSTIVRIRDEVFELHTGFSLAAALSKLGAAAKESLLSTIPTSDEPSEPLSEAASAP